MTQRPNHLSLGEAAKLTGKAKSTILRSINKGELSAQRDGSRYLIDPAELHRVYEVTVPQNVAQPAPRNDTQPQNETPETPQNTAALETEIRLLRELLDRERETVDDLRQRLDRSQALLEHRQEQPPRRWRWPWER